MALNNASGSGPVRARAMADGSVVHALDDGGVVRWMRDGSVVLDDPPLMAQLSSMVDRLASSTTITAEAPTPATATATRVTTTSTSESGRVGDTHGLSSGGVRLIEELARHKRAGTGPFQPKEERDVSRFRAGMRVRIRGTRECGFVCCLMVGWRTGWNDRLDGCQPSSHLAFSRTHIHITHTKSTAVDYHLITRKLTVEDPEPHRRFVGREGLIQRVCDREDEHNTLFVLPDGAAHAAHYLPDDLEVVGEEKKEGEEAEATGSGGQKRKKVASSPSSSSSATPAAGASAKPSSGGGGGKKQPLPPRSMSPPPSPVVQGVLGAQAKVKVAVASRAELEVRVFRGC